MTTIAEIDDTYDVIYKIVQVLFAHFYLRKTNFSSGFSYGKSSA